MTDRVHPTQGEASSQLTSGAIKWAAGSDWIVPSGTDYLAAFAGLSGTPLNGFEETHSSSSYDVTIDTGEGFIGGRWMARDTTTTVTLASSTTNQTVYAGWESSTADSVVIGLDSAFSSTDDGRRTEIWEFDTDGSGTTASRKLHDNSMIHPRAEDADALGGVDSSNYARTDQNESFAGSVSFGNDVSMNANNVESASRVTSHANNALVEFDAGGSDDALALHTSGSGSSDVRIWDRSNSSFILQAHEGGNVEIPNGGLDIHADFGQLSLHESDTGEQWNVAASSNNLNLVNPNADGLFRVFPGGNVEAPNGVMSDSRGTAVVTGSHRYIWVSSNAPSDTDGQDGDIWIEH